MFFFKFKIQLLCVADYKLYLHKFFKFDGTTQGIPVSTIYSWKYKSPKSTNVMRFDWYKNSSNEYVQVAALVECIFNETSKLFIIGFVCTEAGVQQNSMYPLPRIKYLMTLKFLPYMVCDKVDCVSEPVAVIPASGNAASYFKINQFQRSKEIFNVIPIGFLYRDDWDSTPNQKLITFHDKVLGKFGLREYYNGTEAFKNNKFTDLIGILHIIGKKGVEVTEEEVLQEVKENLRYNTFTEKRKFV